MTLDTRIIRRIIIDFYASGQSGAQRLPNGNTLICHGPKGIFFEVTPNNEIVWIYFNLYGSRFLFKINYYPPDYPGIKSHSIDKHSNKINILFNKNLNLWFLDRFPLLERLLNIIF